jgi:hypothetical protein
LPEAAWGRVRVVTQHPRPTLAMVEKVWAKGGEGMILKRPESFYEDGVRSGDWVKVKRIEAHTVTLIGFQQGLDGPTGIIRYRFDDGVEGTTRNTTIKRQQETAKNPKAYIGRRFVLEMQQRHVSGAAMQPRFSAWKDEPATFDHWAGKAE